MARKPADDNDPEPTWWSDWLLITAVVAAIVVRLVFGPTRPDDWRM